MDMGGTVLRELRGFAGDVRRALLMRSIPVRARWDLVALAAAKRIAAPEIWSVHLSPGAIYLAGQNLGEDYLTLYEIFGREAYRAGYEDAVVIDVGGYRGYFGAYAFRCGARSVFSFEPEAGNCAYLDKAAHTFRGSGLDWRTHNVAVSSERGTATLHVMPENRAHSLLDRGSVVTEMRRVPVVAMSDVIAEARAPECRLVAKIDAEGSECSIVLGTSPDLWNAIDEVFVEAHDFASCSREALITHLCRAGLSYRGTTDEWVTSVVLRFTKDRSGS